MLVKLAGNWVFVSENEVIFVVGAALVRAEHNREGGTVVEIGQVFVGLRQKLHVRSATLDSSLILGLNLVGSLGPKFAAKKYLEGNFILNDEISVELKQLCIGDQSMVLRLFFEH